LGILDSTQQRYALGRAYERNGEFEQAKTWYGKAAERGNQEVRESLNRVENQKLAK
jgi:TPR repeat protein